MDSIIEHEKLSSIVNAEDQKIQANPKSGLIEKRIECKLVKNYLKRGNAREFVFDCDEPISNGGDNTAPQATEYFLAGAGFCELSLYARYAALLGIKVDSMEITVIGRMNKHIYWTKRPVGRIGQVIPGFSDITFETRIRSSENPARIKELAAEVEGRCPIFATIRNPTPVQNIIFLNGKPIASEPLEVEK